MTIWTPAKLQAADKTGTWVDFSDAANRTLAGSKFASLTDKFGNGFHAKQETDSKQPTLVVDSVSGLDVGALDGTDDYLSFGTALGKPANYSIIAVIRFSSLLFSSYILGSSNTTGDSCDIWGLVGQFSGLNGKAFWCHSKGAPNTSTNYRYGNTSSAVFVTTEFAINSIEFTDQANDDVIRRNGVVFASTAQLGTATANSGTAYEYAIGRLGSLTGPAYAEGFIGDVLILKSVLGSTDRQLTEGYLAWKWNIYSGLDAAHPFRNGAPYIVPDVVGLSQSAAVTAIETGAYSPTLSATVTTAYSETIPTGEVISQGVAADTILAGGSAVDIVVSKGPDSFGCPSILNKEETTAQSILTAAGLISGTVGSTYSFIIPIGYVVSQYPLPDTAVMSGDAVDYNLSLGGVPVSYIPMSLVVPQFFDANGVPLASGVITAYVAGGTSAAYFYSDSTGAGATQSITLNSRGEPETGGQTYIPFLDNTVSYKVKLKNAAGTEIYTTPDSGFTPYDNTGVPVDSSISTAKIQDDAVTFAKIQNIATARLLGRATAGTGAVGALTLTQVLDLGGTAAQGNLLYRGASAWGLLAPGTAGDSLISGGAAANPAWSSINTIYANSTNQSIGTGVGWQKLPGGLTVKWGRFTSDSDNAIAVTFGTDQGGAFATICVGVTISPYTGTATNMWSPALIATTGFTSKRDGSIGGSIECQYMAIGY